MLKIKRGKVIVLESVDGAGKGAVVEALRKHFKDRQDILFTREPGGTPLGEEVRSILLNRRHDDMHVKTDILLHFAYRPQHYRDVISPALEKGINVIMDRCDISTFAFEVFGRNAEDLFNDVARLCAWVRDLPDDYVKSGGHIFDKIIFLDLVPEIGLKRIIDGRGLQGLDRYEAKELDFHRRVYAGYHKLCNAKLFGPWEIIDATKSPDEVALQVIKIVESMISPRVF